MKETNKWSDLGIKDKLAILTALVAFAAGWILTGVAAFVPLLISEQSVLFILGQSLCYSAAVFGVSAYFNSESRRLKNDVNQMFYEERKRLREEEETEQQ